MNEVSHPPHWYRVLCQRALTQALRHYLAEAPEARVEEILAAREHCWDSGEFLPLTKEDLFLVVTACRFTCTWWLRHQTSFTPEPIKLTVLCEELRSGQSMAAYNRLHFAAERALCTGLLAPFLTGRVTKQAAVEVVKEYAARHDMGSFYRTCARKPRVVSWQAPKLLGCGESSGAGLDRLGQIMKDRGLTGAAAQPLLQVLPGGKG